MTDDRVVQEFYCATSGGGCGGYITFPLNGSLNGVVEMVCPKCGHKHQRMVENGQIKESGRYTNKPTQTIEPTMAAWSEKPKTKAMRDLDFANERDAAVVTSSRDFLRDREFEIYGDRL